MSIAEIISDPDSRWLVRNAPADESALRVFLEQCHADLPREYVDLLRHINGGEGDLAISPWWFQLWPVEKIMEHNEGYEVDKWHPGFLGFGSSGGCEMFAFDTNETKPWRVLGVPFDSIDPEDIDVVASDFLAFARALGYSA